MRAMLEVSVPEAFAAPFTRWRSSRVASAPML